MFSSSESQQFTLLLCVVLLVALLRKKNSRRQRLPPGPSPVGLLRNVCGVDMRHPWKMYARWGNKYGDILYIRLLTQDLIVINSEKVAQDLLDRRSHNYSSRPESIISIMKFLGADFFTIFLPYGARWRLHRRIFHQVFHVTAAPTFHPIQLRKVHDLIMRLISTPHDFLAHLHVLSSSLIMSLVYGYEVSGLDDPILAQLQRATDIVENTFRPKMFGILVTLPFLKHLPEWFPGASFKRDALVSRKIIPECVDVPFEYVKKSMAAGTAARCMVTEALSRIQGRAETEAEAASLEKEVKEASATAYSAAAETTHSTLMVFFLAMILYPDVQARAQTEIDSVIDKGLPRLPHWEDRSELPYVEAVVKETLRWYPVVPLAAPHATVDDDEYEGYYIPKGAMVMVNAWALSRDPIKFPEPEKFKPERFLQGKSQPVDELSFAFGFGRRVCVGRHVADASLWISIVSLLAVFRLEAPASWDPGPDGVNVKWTAGLTTRPEEFPCEIKPRHKNLSPEKLAAVIGLAAL